MSFPIRLCQTHLARAFSKNAVGLDVLLECADKPPGQQRCRWELTGLDNVGYQRIFERYLQKDFWK